MIALAFTTRIPQAVMIAMGIKQWENRNAMPTPASGKCAMTCSRSSGEREYANFFACVKQCFPAEVFNALPSWDAVPGWWGKLIALYDYDMDYGKEDAVLSDNEQPLIMFSNTSNIITKAIWRL